MKVIEVELRSPGTLEGDVGAAKLVQGPPGESATVEIGTVTRGEEAAVTNVGSGTHAVLDFVLPKGDKGDTGETGPKGDTGAQGPAGADGKSAYQAAVEAGYSGTEAELCAALASLGDINGVLDAINGEVV